MIGAEEGKSWRLQENQKDMQPFINVFFFLYIHTNTCPPHILFTKLNSSCAHSYVACLLFTSPQQALGKHGNSWISTYHFSGEITSTEGISCFQFLS